ncbi:MAG: class I SAM-dependent methyltransferase [Planctomycetota bacterium]
MAAYSEAVKSGLYAKRSGLTGKYDNVRKYWEDEITRLFLRPHLRTLIERSRDRMRRVRIMDLGCGSADGYELLSGTRMRDPDLQDYEVDLLTPDVFGLYKGVDLNDALLDQARDIYGESPKLRFAKGDFTEGLPLEEGEKPYDLYFTSFGTMSHHNKDSTAVRLLADIAQRVEHYAIIMCDWLGRYSYEWQTLWTNNLSKHRNMDYVVSYIYEKQEREQRRDELQHLNLRLMSRQEVEAIVAKASEKAGVEISPLVFFDRSTFTGRHMDTQEYNPHAQPIRKAINSLHEANLRTDLNSLMINYVPKPGFDFLNEYFEHLQMCWNTLVHHTGQLLAAYDGESEQFVEKLPAVPASYPKALRDMMERMRHVIEGVGWLNVGLPRENIIEPQLGYALRHLAMGLQQGQGCAHGLVGIFAIDKDKT